MEDNAFKPKSAPGAGAPQDGGCPGQGQPGEAPRESAESFRTIIENTHAGYFRIGLDGRFQ